MSAIKAIGLLLLGAAGGFFGGYIFCQKKLEEEYHQDIEEYKDILDEKYATGKVLSYAPKEEESIIGEDENVAPKTQKWPKENRKIITDYNKPPLSSFGHAEPEDDEEESEENADEDEESEYEREIAAEEEAIAAERSRILSIANREEPYLIDYHMFTDLDGIYDQYDRIHIYWYRQDDVLCHADTDEILDDDEEEALGPDDFYIALENQTNVYIRNERLRTDFHITALNRSYSEDIGGFIGTDRERIYRRVSREKSIE